jgi:hypothetical protein
MTLTEMKGFTNLRYDGAPSENRKNDSGITRGRWDWCHGTSYPHSNSRPGSNGGSTICTRLSTSKNTRRSMSEEYE